MKLSAKLSVKLTVKTVAFALLLVLMSGIALAQAWQDLPLTDARTGKSFTLGNLEGYAYVEPMATWCSNCRQQLGNVRDAAAQVKGDKVTFVALSVETTLKADDLARYAEEQGFDFKFAVMTPEVLRALVAGFSRTIAVPPSTPHFIIYPDGSTSELMTGFSSPDTIIAAVRP